MLVRYGRSNKEKQVIFSYTHTQTSISCHKIVCALFVGTANLSTYSADNSGAVFERRWAETRCFTSMTASTASYHQFAATQNHPHIYPMQYVYTFELVSILALSLHLSFSSFMSRLKNTAIFPLYSSASRSNFSHRTFGANKIDPHRSAKAATGGHQLTRPLTSKLSKHSYTHT